MAPNLHVEPVKDEDMPRCMEIFNRAFEFIAIQEISHGKNTAENRLISAQRHLQGQREHMDKFPSAPVCIKCVHTDPSTGDEKIVGYAEWYIYDRARTEEECLTEKYIMDFAWVENEEHRERCLAFVKPGNEARRRLMGCRAFGQLKFLCVDPGHRRQGIGSLVVQWGMDRCAELGIPAYLEASAEGMALYNKLGFETMAAAEDGGYLFPAMIWWPASAKRE